MFLINFSLLFVFCGSKTGIANYKSFETPSIDKSNYETVYSDSLVTFHVNVYAMSYEQDIYVHLVSNISAGENLIMDSLSSVISFLMSKDTAHYSIRKYFIQTNDTNITLIANNNNPISIRGFQQPNKKTEYELDYIDRSRNGIPKSVKQMKVEIYAEYKLGQKNYVRRFIVDLKSKNHLFVQLIPKC
jgi:hypothetical protein